MLFSEMLVEVPPTGNYNVDPSLQPEIRDVHTLLQAINYQIQSPISYNDSPQIGTPINAILD
jgi:phosphatidylserine decarboxylase